MGNPAYVEADCARRFACVAAVGSYTSHPRRDFIVVTAKPSAGNRGTIRSFCADLPALIRSVGFRELEGSLSCVLGFGSEAWDRLFGQPRPAELHKFHEIRAGERHAVSTPGDMLFHIRAQR